MKKCLDNSDCDKGESCDGVRCIKTKKSSVLGIIIFIIAALIILGFIYAGVKSFGKKKQEWED